VNELYTTDYPELEKSLNNIKFK